MFPIACMVFVMNSLSAAVINYRQQVIILQHCYSVTLTKKRNKPKTKTAFKHNGFDSRKLQLLFILYEINGKQRTPGAVEKSPIHFYKVILLFTKQ